MRASGRKTARRSAELDHHGKMFELEEQNSKTTPIFLLGSAGNIEVARFLFSDRYNTHNITIVKSKFILSPKHHENSL